MWVSGLLMSTLWIELPMVAVGLWYGQAYVMDSEHGCILLMAFWMHRDTVRRFWGPLLCPSSTTITSCCSMIMHGPMLQGSVHMLPIEHGWDALDRSIRQRVPVPANIQQLRTAIEEEWTNIPQATTNNLINYLPRRCVALLDLWFQPMKNGSKNKSVAFIFLFSVEPRTHFAAPHLTEPPNYAPCPLHTKILQTEFKIRKIPIRALLTIFIFIQHSFVWHILQHNWRLCCKLCHSILFFIIWNRYLIWGELP